MPGLELSKLFASIPWLLNIPVLGCLCLRDVPIVVTAGFLPDISSSNCYLSGVLSTFFLFYQPSDRGMLLASSAFAWLLIGVVIDFETMLIPDRFSIGGACAGFVLPLFSFHRGPFYPGLGAYSLGTAVCSGY